MHLCMLLKFIWTEKLIPEDNYENDEYQLQAYFDTDVNVGFPTFFQVVFLDDWFVLYRQVLHVCVLLKWIPVYLLDSIVDEIYLA